MVVRELLTRLGFQADNRAVDKHESSLRKVRRAAMALTAAYTATVGAAAALATRMANTGNEIAKNAQEAGLAVGEYQSLVFAMGQVAQVSDQDVNRALGRLNQRIGRAAREGGKYAEALQEMGFSQQQVAEGGITTGAAMDALTEQLANARNEQEASAIAGDVLGTRLGRRLGPALYRNSEAFREQAQRARELGGGYSEVATAAGEDFIDTLSEVGLITTTISGEIAERLVPAVDAVVSSMVEWWVANRELVLQNLRRYMDTLARGFAIVQRVVGGTVSVIDRIAKAMGGWESTLRALGIAISLLLGYRIAAWLWGAVAAMGAAGSAAKLLTAAMLRIPIVAIVAGLVLIIDELWNWYHGNETIIEKVLGTWKDFAAEWKALLDDAFAGEWQDVLNRMDRAVDDFADSVRNKLMGLLPEWLQGFIEGGGLLGAAARGGANIGDAEGREGAADALNILGGAPPQIARDVESSGSSRRDINVNARIDSTLQVPPGTTEEQKRELRGEVERIFEDQFSKEINRTLNNMPAAL